MNILEVLTVLDPFTIVMVILSGWLMGTLAFKSLNITKGTAVRSIVMFTAFITMLSMTRGLQGVAGWERWIGGYILFLLFLGSGFIGEKFTKPALFLHIL